jgi:hypothetical protein
MSRIIISRTRNVHSKKPVVKLGVIGLDTRHMLSWAELELGLACIEFGMDDISLIQGKSPSFPGSHHNPD